MMATIKHLILIFLCLLTSLTTFATHNRAGEITFRHVKENIYEFTIRTCTRYTEVDRAALEVSFGDNTGVFSVSRSRSIIIDNRRGREIKKNEYVIRHNYSGAGTYTVQVLDPNRNEGIVNILSSVNEPFLHSNFIGD